MLKLTAALTIVIFRFENHEYARFDLIRFDTMKLIIIRIERGNIEPALFSTLNGEQMYRITSGLVTVYIRAKRNSLLESTRALYVLPYINKDHCAKHWNYEAYQ